MKIQSVAGPLRWWRSPDVYSQEENEPKIAGHDRCGEVWHEKNVIIIIIKKIKNRDRGQD